MILYHGTNSDFSQINLGKGPLQMTELPIC